ncbi:hypothetical protein R3W88_024481 [Solanum pinnatisectum]|uniref:PIK-related kinase FAT domain-containing protein n=1 Tax=Solanum pinnatisectum TaxID=50273 RepID=A0AAV9M1B3_9SOLN|nr:hypothetical protein R3W88_024481 [Solanum pinnatisectum]
MKVNDGRLHTIGEASQRTFFLGGSCLLQVLLVAGHNLVRLVRSLEMTFSSPNIPPEILTTLLNLVEFMEHDERPLPIDIRLLGALAGKCRAFAKALHYKEMEFEGTLSNRRDANPVAVVVALIHINNQLHQYEAAVGILTYAQQHLGVQLKESWYEKLQLWDDALKAYTDKASQALSPHLCLDATLVRRAKYDEAYEYFERARKCLATELAALVLESYERAYNNTVHVQQLSELEEVIEYCTLPPMGNPIVEGRRALFPNMWNERIKGAKGNDEVLPDLFHIVRISEDGLKEFITWKLGTLVSIARQILHLVEQPCFALNDEFRKYLPDRLPCCIQVLTDAERFNDYTYVTGHISSLVHHLKLVLDGNKEELRKAAIDALRCLAHALGEDFTIFIPSIHKLMV